MNLLPCLVCCLLMASSSVAIAASSSLSVVAAENFYGDIAQQIGGADVTVTSILSNPDVDPHLFETSASVAREVASAHITIMNGINYDPWMAHLVEASRSAKRLDIDVAALVGRQDGDNPHIWYRPETMLVLARKLCAAYQAADPAHATDYAGRLAQFEASMVPVQQKIAALKQRLSGYEVAATEPIFGYLLSALGMVLREQGFQLAVMNGTEVSASQVKSFESDLKNRRLRLLVFNRQAKDQVADRMKAIAIESGIPVVGASETEPQGETYQSWMMDALSSVAEATLGDRK